MTVNVHDGGNGCVDRKLRWLNSLFARGVDPRVQISYPPVSDAPVSQDITQDQLAQHTFADVNRQLSDDNVK
ncbi:hypothetical protein JG688_00014285 [Phytophthora aleatoria]|uniref:Uncharacterized protein n=1 Tax=Phytophthora aleatoria TaxID=2496075 RepID=A0A8J5I7L0_9STRA|nr:hypothetical protein JG688_00014285 [Phytophthora aleatoria]